MRVINADYDVVVCGGGLAGFSAALSAARHGARTALLHDRPVLGGNSSSEVRVTVHGSAAVHPYGRETGVVSEALIHERAINHAAIEENGWTNSVWDLVLYDMATRTDNLTLHLNTVVHEVDVRDGIIDTVVARVPNAETEIRARARYVIDCTGDGTVGALAGVTSFHGIEAASEYDEPHAPEEASEQTMGSSLHFKTVDAGRPVPFAAPEWAARYDDPAFFSTGGRTAKTLASGYWWIEIGPPWNTIHDNEEIRHELTRQVLGIWDFLKNRDPYWSPRAENLALDWVGQVPGKRESRRLLGEHFITEHDLKDGVAFDDEVAFGGWYVDLHTPGGLYATVAEPVTSELFVEAADDSSENRDAVAGTDSKYVGPYGIPLRAMISKEVSNLLYAGRNISATHAALGSLRVMGTVATMGQAVGTHAADLVDRGVERAGELNEVARLQQTLLRDGCFLPHVRNSDPLDHALRATASASSSQRVHGVGPSGADNLGGLGQWSQGHPVFPANGKLDSDLAQWIAVDSSSRIETLSLCLSNDSDTPRHVDASLVRVDGIWDYRLRAGDEIRSATLEVPPGGPHWVSWPVQVGAADVGGAGYVRVQLRATPEVEWKLSPTLLPGQVAGYAVSPERLRRFGGGATLSFAVEPALAPYGPENVLTGVTRPAERANVWRSDPDSPLPQWLELSWPEPVEISQVQLTFAGNLLREYHATPPQFRDPQTVKRYALAARVDDEWVEIAAADDNYTNRVVHTFDAVDTDRVRLTVYETNGDPSAALYEIRCYAEPVCTDPSFP